MPSPFLPYIDKKSQHLSFPVRNGFVRTGNLSQIPLQFNSSAGPVCETNFHQKNTTTIVMVFLFGAPEGTRTHTLKAREPKSFGLFFRPQLSTALRSRKPLKPQGFVHFRARLRRENKMQNFLVGENQGENSQRTGENFLGPITGRTNYDKPHDPLLMAILQEVVKHEVESILRGNLFSIP